jgi:hypothetical protein
MVPSSSSQIKTLDGVAKSAAKKRRVKKTAFLQNEASSSEASRQLEWEKNRQKIVNLAANGSSNFAVCDAFRKVASLNQCGKNTVNRVNTKVLLPLQGHQIGDVIRTGKVAEKGGVIRDIINLEIKKGQSHESVTQNMEVEVCDGKVQAGKPLSQNIVDVSERPKQTPGQEAVPRLACVTSYKNSCKIANKHVDVKTSDIRGNMKQATGVSVPTPTSSQVSQAHVVIKSQSISATDCRSSSGTAGKAPSSGVSQRKKNETLKQSVGNVQPVVQAKTDVICISDSDDDDDDDYIEYLGSEYNPRLDFMYDRQKRAEIKCGQSAAKIGGNLTPQQTDIASGNVGYVERTIPAYGMKPETLASTVPKSEHSSVRTQNNWTPKQTPIAQKSDLCVQRNISTCGMKPGASVSTVCTPELSTVRTQDSLAPAPTRIAQKNDPCVQRKIPTSGMEAAASTGSGVATLPNHVQPVVSNASKVTTHLTHNSTVMDYRVEEQCPVKNDSLKLDTVTENQDGTSETVLRVQPSGSSCSVLGNSVLRSESFACVQSHTPGLCIANEVLSPLHSSSTQNNQKTPVHTSSAVLDHTTSVQESSSMNNSQVHNLQINVGSQIVPSNVSASHVSSSVNPYIVIVGTYPGTSVIQVTASDPTNRHSDTFTEVISSDAALSTTKSPVFKSSTSSKIPGCELTQTTVPPSHQAGNPSVSTGKIKLSGSLADQGRNYCLPASQANDNLPVNVRSPGLPLVQTKNTGFSATPTKSLHTLSAHTQHRDTFSADTRVRGPNVAQAMSSDTPAGQTGIPGTPVTKTRNSVTSAAQTRSAGTPVAHTRRSGVVFGKTRSPDKINVMQAVNEGASIVQARNFGSPVFQAQIYDAHVKPGARLSQGRGYSSSGPERDSNVVPEQRDQTARLVVIPGEDNVSRYGLVFPSGAKVILTPEQVAEIRAANGGLLTSNFGYK